MEYRLFRWINKQNLDQPVDLLVQKGKSWFESLSDQDLIECLLTGFIPDTYKENKKEEKAFAKMMEVLVAVMFERIGFTSIPLKSKSETEDVRITHKHTTVLIDVKSFRLGRSQLAPNVKDFVKLHTFQNWMNNFNLTHPYQKAIGGIVVYPSTHEWKKHSQVYRECSTKETPILMLPYELLALLLQYKHHIHPRDFLSILHYSSIFPTPVTNRQSYWGCILPLLLHLCGENDNLLEELDILRLYYVESVREAQETLTLSINRVSSQMEEDLKKMDRESLRKMALHLLIHEKISPLQNSLTNILRFRATNI